MHLGDPSCIFRHSNEATPTIGEIEEIFQGRIIRKIDLALEWLKSFLILLARVPVEPSRLPYSLSKRLEGLVVVLDV